ncbi:MAG: DsrE/DsrF/DrsH-like family protein [Acetobacteraceae bacterium]|nr:DsrE/DsrF/DrsH-like family protein [Acetobacteraceae bacterium]
MLLSGTHERAHYAFVLASAAGALGRRVVLFAANEGCHALLEDWSALDQSGRDAALRARGIAGIGELRDAARELGVRMLACESAARMYAIEAGAFTQGVEVSGVAAFLEATSGAQVITL